MEVCSLLNQKNVCKCLKIKRESIRENGGVIQIYNSYFLLNNRLPFLVHSSRFTFFSASRSFLLISCRGKMRTFNAMSFRIKPFKQPNSGKSMGHLYRQYLSTSWFNNAPFCLSFSSHSHLLLTISVSFSPNGKVLQPNRLEENEEETEEDL